MCIRDRRDDKAHAFAMTFKDRPLELGELAFGLLANNLRFVVPNRNERNKSRWKTCRFWERFLGAVEVLKLQVPKPTSFPSALITFVSVWYDKA